MPSPREWRRSVNDLADEYGYDVSTSGSGHLRLTKPGRPTVFTSATSSDRRAIKNLRSKIRRNES